MREWIWLAAACVAPGVLPGTAMAQEAADISEEIIVRASRLAPAREQILQGATVLERADVIERLGQGLGATLDNTPGVSSTAFGAGASRPIIRGLGEDRVRVLSNNLAQIDASTVSPDHAVTTEGLEAERIEILRGPASLAYGGNAVGGVVNVVDGVIAEALPKKAISGHGYGAYTTGLRAAEGAGHIEAAVGPLVFNAQGFRRSSRDYAIPGFAFSAPLRARLLAQAAASAEPAPDLAQFRATNTQSAAGSYNFGVALVGKVLGRPVFAGASFKRVTSQYGIPEAPGLEAEGEAPEPALFPGPFIDLASNRYEGKAGVRDIGLFSEVRASLAVVNYEHTEFEPSGEPGTRFSNQGVNARFEASHKSIGGVRGLVGFEALTTDFGAEGAEAFITPTQTRDFAGFLIERFEHGPLSIEGGFRYGEVRVRNEAAGERRFGLYNLSLGAGYQASEAVFLSLNITRSQRAPTQTELFSDGPHLATASFERGNADLGVERALSIEGGARLSHGRFSLEANGFSHGFDGFVALVANGETEESLPVFLYTQRDARFLGGEISGKAELIKKGDWTLSVDASIDLVRAYFQSGGAVPRIPPLSTHFGLDGGVGPLKLRFEWERASAQQRSAAFESTTPGFDLFNARLGFKPIKDGPLNLLIEARNLTDEEARVHTSFVKDFLPRPGRTIRFAAIVDF